MHNIKNKFGDFIQFYQNKFGDIYKMRIFATEIHYQYARVSLPMPIVESVEGGVRVTFQRNNPNGSQKSSQKGSQKGSQKTSDKILQLIKENPRITREVLAESTDISSRMVAKYLKTLQEQGILKRIGGRKEGYWEWVD